jgi:hypothetical protein
MNAVTHETLASIEAEARGKFPNSPFLQDGYVLIQLKKIITETKARFAYETPEPKPNTMTNLSIYVKSMGKVFKVVHLSPNAADANDYCSKHPCCAVMAEDKKTGIILIADKYSLTIPSNLLPE